MVLIVMESEDKGYLRLLLQINREIKIENIYNNNNSNNNNTFNRNNNSHCNLISTTKTTRIIKTMQEIISEITIIDKMKRVNNYSTIECQSQKRERKSLSLK